MLHVIAKMNVLKFTMQKKSNAITFDTIILEFPTPIFSNTLGSVYNNMEQWNCPACLWY